MVSEHEMTAPPGSCSECGEPLDQHGDCRRCDWEAAMEKADLERKAELENNAPHSQV